MSDQQETTQPLSENQASQEAAPQETNYQIKNISRNNFGKSKKFGVGFLAILFVLGASLSLSSANHTTMLTMDFDAQHSVVNAGNQYLLKPVIARLIESHQE